MGLPVTKFDNWTYDQYLNLENDKRYEIFGGNLLVVPAPDFNHQYISSRLFSVLNKYIEFNNAGYLVHAPTDVVLDKENVIQPDLLFISLENTNIIQKKGVFGTPDLVIEIISPSSKYRDTYEKKQLYEHFKIKEYWLVEPGARTIEVLTLNNKGIFELFSEGNLEEEGSKKIKSKVLESLEINLENIFDKSF